MENTEIKPFVTEAVSVITDKSGNELNIEYYADEIAMFGTYQSTGWDDPILKSIQGHLQAILDALPDNEDGEVPEDFKMTIQGAKKPPVVKVNINIYSEEGVVKTKIAEFIQKIEAGIAAN